MSLLVKAIKEYLKDKHSGFIATERDDCIRLYYSPRTSCRCTIIAEVYPNQNKILKFNMSEGRMMYRTTINYTQQDILQKINKVVTNFKSKAIFKKI